MSPVNSLIQDSVNGLATIRCLNQKDHFMERLYESTDKQTCAHITSNGGNRWTALRIDFQAYIIATGFAFYAMFLQGSERSAAQLAITAVGLQMAIEVTRQFDMAIRWSVSFENDMGSI